MPQTPIGCDQRGSKIMGDQAAFGFVDQPEQAGNCIDLLLRASGKRPAFFVCRVTTSVFLEDFWTIEFWINRDAQKLEPLGKFLLQPLLQRLKILRHERAEVRQRTSRVNECQNDRLASKIR